jgi:hypothetical protein
MPVISPRRMAGVWLAILLRIIVAPSNSQRATMSLTHGAALPVGEITATVHLIDLSPRAHSRGSLTAARAPLLSVRRANDRCA